jgi:hypothetical protein
METRWLLRTPNWHWIQLRFSSIKEERLRLRAKEQVFYGPRKHLRRPLSLYSLRKRKRSQYQFRLLQMKRTALRFKGCSLPQAVGEQANNKRFHNLRPNLPQPLKAQLIPMLDRTIRLLPMGVQREEARLWPRLTRCRAPPQSRM